MSTPALWELVRDWLAIEWHILEVRPPMNDESAFIVFAEKPAEGDERYILPKYREVKSDRQDYRMVKIEKDRLLFWRSGRYDNPLKASDPNFFNKLDEILLTLFSNSEWWQKKVGWSITGKRRKWTNP